MKNKKTILIATLSLILILVGASILYNKLTEHIKPQGNGLSAENYNNIIGQNNSSNGETNENTEKNNSSENKEPIKAPDFKVIDSEGNTVHLSDFIGKPIVLNFWASWCGPCKMEMPAFDKMYQEKGKEIHFLMVNMTDNSRETVKIAKTFIKEQDYSFPVYYDTEIDAAITYGVTSLPTTYFIDSNGYAIAQAMGAIDETTLQTGIDMITKE